MLPPLGLTIPCLITSRALCVVVRADSQIVLVDELITGHLSLPGGTVVSGEPPAIAAQRETLGRRTGLSVTVGDVLGYTDSAVVYDCISDSGSDQLPSSKWVRWLWATKAGSLLIMEWKWVERCYCRQLNWKQTNTAILNTMVWD